MAADLRSLSDFAGAWRVDRVIHHAKGPDATFAGQADWTPCTQGLRYRETGQLIIAGHAPFLAEREYLWLPDLSVLFDDGRFFHRVPAAGGEAHHWCDPDDYVVSYDFGGWPGFTTRWQVRGPRKDYVMTATYARTGPARVNL
ncbi:DUF6314 family protein [Arenibacterium sp. CAU 1754]